MSNNMLINEDCLIAMKRIPNESVDMIFTDLPYNTTNNDWDKQPIDLSALWKEYDRIIKPNGCIALWAQAPFSHILAASNSKEYRYEWIIEKTRGTGHLNAKKMPMKVHETIQIFYKKLPVYNPQMTTGHKPVHSYTKHTDDGSNYGITESSRSGGGSTERYPRDVLTFKWDTRELSYHPCQKPLEACKYFIKTYTNIGDTVLDSCMGSNTTGIACEDLQRKYIGIEKDPDIFKTAVERIKHRREIIEELFQTTKDWEEDGLL